MPRECEPRPSGTPHAEPRGNRCSESAPSNRDDRADASYFLFRIDAGAGASNEMRSEPIEASADAALLDANDNVADPPAVAPASPSSDAAVAYPKLGTHVDGGFFCGNAYPFEDGYPPQAVCDQKTQYCCIYNADAPATEGCHPFDAGPFPTSANCWPPRCSCYPLPSLLDCSCTELDDAGSLAVSCGSCYGSPPARRRAPMTALCLERPHSLRTPASPGLRGSPPATSGSV
jgi:hypothetical protein